MQRIAERNFKLALTEPSDGAETRALLHMVARLHYEQGRSQVSIAKQIGVSTATVSRMLGRARAEGIVRIEVRDLVPAEDLAGRLARALGLRRAVVADAPAADPGAALAGPLGVMLAGAGLGPGSVLAVGWGRAIRAVLDAGLPALPGIVVVPATGGLQQQAPHFQINEFARRAAEQAGGTARFLHAPYLPSAAARAGFLADPAIAGTVALWDRIDVAVVGVGLPHARNAPEASVATPHEQRLTRAAGDVIRHYFDADGRPVEWEGAARLIAASPAQLRAARLTIGVAWGGAKAGPVIGAARAGLITALVADLRLAEAALAELAA